MEDRQPSKYFEVELYSHNFVVKNMSPSGRQIAMKFARNFIEYGWVRQNGRNQKVGIQTWASYVAAKNEIHFHINQFDEWKKHLADTAVPEHGYTEVTYGFVTPEPLNCLITKDKTPRDYQVEISETYLHVPEPSWRKFVGIDPGMGKTYLACWAAAEYNFRIVGFLKPKYLKKWPNDLMENLGMDKDDIISVSGSAKLMSVMTRAREGTLTEKAILISNRTYLNYIKLYEKYGDEILGMGYDCTPLEFCQLIRAGTRLIDEVHEEFFCMFKIDLYTHIPRSISLSATLEDDDPFTEAMFKTGYPVEQRCKIVVRKKYIISYALRYNLKHGEEFQTSEYGSTSYSHIAFEKNFFTKRYGYLLNAYLELIAERFEERFLTRYEDGQKCLIYAASIQMCTTIVEFLKRKYPGLDVRRYVAEDPYDNLMKAVVSVSTIGSSGTGHDIAGLITVMLTHVIRARAANIQGPGRLREIPGVDVEFEYFTCKDVPKHMEYHLIKELLLAERTKSNTIVDLPYVVGG